MPELPWFLIGPTGKRVGPLTQEELVARLLESLPPETLVWQHGMPGWARAKDLAALGPFLPPPRPPSQPGLPAPAPIAPARTGAGMAYRSTSAAAARGLASRAGDEPYTLNPFVLFARSFNFDGRFDRGQFAIAYFGSLVLFVGLLVPLGVRAGPSGLSTAETIVVAGRWLILTPIILIEFGSMFRRLHDMGQPGWYCLLSLLPGLGLLLPIYLLAAPGDPNATPAVNGGVSPTVVAVVAIVGLLVGIAAIPSVLRARVSANEATAIRDIRAIISAEAAYQSWNGGFYDGNPRCLTRPGDCLRYWTADTFAGGAKLRATFGEGAAIARPKSGYVRELVAGPPGRDLPAGLSRSSVTSFAVVAHPITAGLTGVRSFCGDSSGRVCYDPQGGANLVDKRGNEVLCSTTCQDQR